jgi:hypothetical protein
MRQLILASSALLLAACGTTAYGPYGLNRGYIGGRTQPGVYQVAGNTTPRTRSGFAAEMALYRAAELAKEDGFRFIQLVYFDGGALAWGSAAGGMMLTGTSGERFVARVRGIEAMTTPIQCEMDDLSQCRNLDINEFMAKVGPRLGIPAPE